MPLTFVGIESTPITHSDGTQTLPVATLEFTARTQPGGPRNRELAVAFDLVEFCKTRLTKGIDKNGNSAKLSWYSHWKEVDGQMIYTGKNAGPSVASIYRLSHLEQQGLRESQAYKDAVYSMSEFSDTEKADLTKFAASHGSTREQNGTQTVSQKTDKIIDSIKAHGIVVVDSHLTPAEKAELAEKIEQTCTAVVEQCRQPLAEQEKANAEQRKLEQAVADAETELQATLDNKKATASAMRTAMQAKIDAEQALSDHKSSQEQVEPAPEPAADSDQSEQAEPVAPADSQPEPTAEQSA